MQKPEDIEEILMKQDLELSQKLKMDLFLQWFYLKNYFHLETNTIFHMYCDWKQVTTLR